MKPKLNAPFGTRIVKLRGPLRWGLLLPLVALLTSGCATIEKMAMTKMADALAAGGTTFTSDDDPDLVGEALPFSLKLMETLLEQVPTHEGLLYATASGFTQYSYAYVQQEADELEDDDLDAAYALRQRARRLYLRARNYGLRGLEAAHPGFADDLRTDPDMAVAVAQEKDVPLLFWTASGWAAAIAISKDDMELIGDLPIIEALIDRAYELDADYDSGALDSFLITYEMTRLDHPDPPEVRARRHYARAVKLSGGHQAAPHLALAEAVSVVNQDRSEFERLLHRALMVNPDARPEWRLANLIYQSRARWLLDRIDRYFLE